MSPEYGETQLPFGVPLTLRPAVYLEAPHSVHAALINFTREPAIVGNIDAFVAQYTRSGEALPQGHFSLKTFFQGMQYFNRDTFFVDGSHGVGLIFQNNAGSDQIWFAAASFSCGKEINQYASINASEISFPRPYPVIVQLHGRGLYKEITHPQRRRQIGTLLRAIKWECLFVDLLKSWASWGQIPRLYLLPAAMNRYANTLVMERYQRRYDETAVACGMTMQSNGLWGVEIDAVHDYLGKTQAFC